MDDPYRALSQRERDESDQLAEDASERGSHVLSRSTMAAGALAIEAAANARDERAGQIAIRTDSRFQLPLVEDLRKARQQAESAILEALRIGYATDLNGRAAALEAQSSGLRISVDITGSDLVELHDWPIQGHTGREVADYLVTTLRYAVDSVMASPLAAAEHAKALPSMLADAARLHGVRLGNAVSEAYYAAVRKATQDLRKARLV